ncbi:hypothetical protein [Spirosoma foliorum]|uniref:Uncharacterized protein n=1 Tax=Spirosoma foliorum TaxID=2710596 RepID=A0A7G5H2J4_9BACT|nr:hypothetical protein [Spirosoma foliorum]QMW05336.1 hypothetical protein H3H32_10825 [Spirosoma foliorum]
MARQVLTLMYNTNVEKKHQCTPEEFMPLPGDPPKKPEGFVPPHVFIDMMKQAFSKPEN